MMPGSGPWWLVALLVAVTSLTAGIVAGALFMMWHGARMAREQRRRNREQP